MDKKINVIYLFSTFPVITETPSQREIRVMNTLNVNLDIYSLWGGEREFEGLQVQLFPKYWMISLLWYLPYWIFKKPAACKRYLHKIISARKPSMLNLGETIIGITFALIYAKKILQQEPDLLHAAWATIPATAAQLLRELTGIPFTLGAHAFDVFRDGGDCLLESKLQDAACIITSSYSTWNRLAERGAPPEKTRVIRRGMDTIPPLSPMRSPRNCLRILCVAQLVGKKGYFEQLLIYRQLLRENMEFEVRIVGGGPLAAAINKRVAALGLADHVQLLGPLPYSRIAEQYAWADVMIYTGKIAPDQNRDGLPNVIPEAMAYGVPVVSSSIAGVPEVIEDGINGIIINGFESSKWHAALTSLKHDDLLYEKLRNQARKWVEANFDAQVNTRQIVEVFQTTKSLSHRQ
jgi:glycosyltransferase involved in cell wall biosynthesis